MEEKEMIKKEYIKAREIIERAPKRGLPVEYSSPKTNVDAERWGDQRIGIIKLQDMLKKGKKCNV